MIWVGWLDSSLVGLKISLIDYKATSILDGKMVVIVQYKKLYQVASNDYCGYFVLFVANMSKF